MIVQKCRSRFLGAAIVLMLLLASVIMSGIFSSVKTLAHQREKGFFKQENLVSDIPGRARFTDPNLVNPWGLTFGPKTPFWVADNGTGVATVYDDTGRPVPPDAPRVITIPTPKGVKGPAAPTGIVFNDTHKFVVSEGNRSAASRFIFATEDGTIAGWNPDVDARNAILAVDRSSEEAIYKGLARVDNLLFATNFHAGQVEVFDGKFRLIDSFTDKSLPAGFAPFGIRNIKGLLYVTFALQDEEKEDDVAGPGNGFVDVFTPDGHLVKRLISRGELNSPWGLALAPDNFGRFSNALLVGNFGDGRINAFDPRTGEFLGMLRDKQGKPIVNEGLWALRFGNGTKAGDPNTLFFTAGLNDEKNGLFGSIRFKQ